MLFFCSQAAVLFWRLTGSAQESTMNLEEYAKAN